MIPKTTAPKVRLNLALQGGGAHGAFTWGVLDRLLAEADITYGMVTGTSAGAVNAVALASGLAKGGNEVARETLERVWLAVVAEAEPDFLKLNPFFATWSRAAAKATLGGTFAPQDFNPFGLNPLKRILGEAIDFSVFGAAATLDVRIAATEVETGLAHHFSGSAITLDAVLASTCLPTLQSAVEINGVPYWDGGFSSNPDLLAPIVEGKSEDTLIVEINPLVREGTPRTARDIASQVNHITFNAPYLRDIALINALRELPDGLKKSSIARMLIRRFVATDEGLAAQSKRHRFHMISGGEVTARYDAETKALPDESVVLSLKEDGRKAASRWLKANRALIGKAETVNLVQHLARAEKARP
jgi:NTE family protein